MDWHASASCRDEEPDLFFPVGRGDSGPALIQTDEAKAVCRRCPVVQECLDRALEAGSVDGIWGGTTESERRALGDRLLRRPRLRRAQASGEATRDAGPAGSPPA